MMCITFNGNPSYNNRSTNTNDETDVSTLYNVLSSPVRHIPKHNVLIIDWDMNAQISKEGKN